MKLHKAEVTLDPGKGQVLIDGVEVRGLSRLTISGGRDEVPTITLSLLGGEVLADVEGVVQLDSEDRTDLLNFLAGVDPEKLGEEALRLLSTVVDGELITSPAQAFLVVLRRYLAG